MAITTDDDVCGSNGGGDGGGRSYKKWVGGGPESQTIFEVDVRGTGMLLASGRTA